jgi:hypothetical protein
MTSPAVSHVAKSHKTSKSVELIRGHSTRTNGNLTLGIQPSWDFEKGKSIGYPYGTIPRLLLFWMTTEALRTKNPRLELGHSLASFMRQLGLDPSRGGKRSDAKRLRDQMRRLFQASISFHLAREEKGRKGEAWLDEPIPLRWLPMLSCPQSQRRARWLEPSKG